MPEKQTTLQAFQELREALKKLADAIEYEIYILRTLETITTKMEHTLEELSKK